MMTENIGNNKIIELENQRKRLRFRSWHRGTKEMDVLLGSFADKYLSQFDAINLNQYERLLNNSDPDLYNWISRNEPLPPAEDNDVMQLFMEFDLTK